MGDFNASLMEGIEQLLIEDYAQRQMKKDSRFFPSVPGQTSGTNSMLTEYMLTNGQVLEQVMKDPQVRQSVKDKLNQQGILHPLLCLDIISLHQADFELDRDDIYEVLLFLFIQTFVRFGHLHDLLIQHKRAYIFFHDLVPAFFAMKCNDNFYIDDLNVKMKLDFLDVSEQRVQQDVQVMALFRKYYSPAQEKVFPNQNIQTALFNKSVPDEQTTKFPTQMPMKYTCKYDILIQPDKQFQLARKIIGSKGINMKKIIESCEQHCRLKDHDAVKLRLRGKGSGYKEGPNKKESNECLHLCVSSKFVESYLMTCHYVEELLATVFGEYKKFMRKRNLPVSLKHAFNKVESQQIPPGCYRKHAKTLESLRTQAE